MRILVHDYYGEVVMFFRKDLIVGIREITDENTRWKTVICLITKENFFTDEPFESVMAKYEGE